MSDEQNHKDIVSLREHLESEINHVRETIRVFKEVIEVRLEGMNELRSQINSERSLSVLRPEHDAVHKALDAEIRSLQITRAEIGSKANAATVYWAGFLAVSGLVISAVSLAAVLLR